MPAAARVTDISTHGGTVMGPGAPTVLIGGLPAAVANDTHVCVIPLPHTPTASPFPMEGTTVLIEGKSALRMGDVCLCGAAVAVGLPTVTIG